MFRSHGCINKRISIFDETWILIRTLYSICFHNKDFRRYFKSAWLLTRNNISFDSRFEVLKRKKSKNDFNRNLRRIITHLIYDIKTNPNSIRQNIFPITNRFPDNELKLIFLKLWAKQCRPSNDHSQQSWNSLNCLNTWLVYWSTSQSS